MPELRFDPFKGRWVNVSPSRATRPTDLGGGDAACPFCPGSEAETPPEIVAIRPPDSAADTPGWCVRVVPNRFPALEPSGEAAERVVGVCRAMDAVGRHEVVIETPDHDVDLDALDPEHMARVVRTLWARVAALEEDPAHAFVLVFRNWGARAGASLAHPHSQVLALPVVPEIVAREVTRSVAHLRRTGKPLAHEMLRHELEGRERIVEDEDGFVVLAPFAAAYPFELAIYPREPAASFRELTEAQVPALGGVLQRTLARLKLALGGPDYNIVLHTAPNRLAAETAPTATARAEADAIAAAYHWHLEIVPRLPRVDGFEWATGLHVNVESPETAARRLRGAG